MRNQLFIYGIIFLAASTAQAGTASSGGGAASVCRDSSGHVISAQLLDFYEGRILYGYEIPESPLTSDQQLARAVGRLNAGSYDSAVTIQELVEVAKSIRFLPAGTALQAPLDVGTEHGTVFPAGCPLEAVGFYGEDGTLLVDRDVYLALSGRDLAGFILHEALYKYERDAFTEISDSSIARHLNAALFSQGASDSELEKLSVQLFDRGYDDVAGARVRNTVFIPGSNAGSLLTVRVTPSQSENYSFRIQCEGLAQSPGAVNRPTDPGLGAPVTFSGSGIATLSLKDENCYAISEWVDLGLPRDDGRTFQVEVLLDGKVLFSRSEPARLFGDIYVAHPEWAIPAISRP